MNIPSQHLHAMDGKMMKSSSQSECDQDSLNILYIEDDAASRNLVQRAFAFREGWQVQLATTLAEAVEALALRPDIILMDIQLRDGNGFQLLSYLRADPELSAIPVIALTAYAMHEQVKEGLAAGFNRYLTKPVKLDDLFAAIEEVC